MKVEEGNPWDGGARAFAGYADAPAGRLRFKMIAETLGSHLPAGCLRVLDAGCGIGEMAILLAEQGHSVTAVDSAAEMLRMAGQRAERLGEAARGRLHLVEADLSSAVEMWPDAIFDLVTAHTLLDYVPDENELLARLLHPLRAGGMISLVRVNHPSQVLRAALGGHDLDAAMRAMNDPKLRASMFDVSGQGSTVAGSAQQLARAGVDLVAAYGIRTLADYLPAGLQNDPAQYESLLNLERTLCATSPYREMARYVHLIGTKRLT